METLNLISLQSAWIEKCFLHIGVHRTAYVEQAYFLTSAYLCRADLRRNGSSSRWDHCRSDADINSMSETVSFFHPVSSLSHSLTSSSSSSSSFLQMSLPELLIFLASPSICCLQRFGFITSAQYSELISILELEDRP